jgi:putative ABC transport system ATP-binding protein
MMNTDTPIIRTTEVWRIYKIGHREIQALCDINLTIPAGKFIAMKGRSGSGKTTLLNCLGGLDRPDKGEIFISGNNLSKLNDSEITRWRSQEVGFVFQSFGLVPTFSAYENVEFMLRLAHRPGKERRKRANECLEMVGLTRWSKHRPYELSGGQQQRVAIARALANNPKIILADEPTGELDSTTAREILSIFRQIVAAEGVTLIMATHDPLVDGYVDNIFHLQDGHVINGSLDKN